MVDRTTDAQSYGSEVRSIWAIRITAILWFLLVVGCLLALPVMVDATILLVAVALVLAIATGAGLAWLVRLFVNKPAHSFLHDWAKAGLGTFCVLCIAAAAPIYYLAVKTETDPLLLPRATLSNGEKTVVYQGMMHIGTERFYKQVVYDAEEALQDGYVLYYEGVQPNPAADKWFADTLTGGGDLSSNYKAMGEICGLKFQLDYFDLLEKQKAANPEMHVVADVDTLQMKQEFDRLAASDPAFAIAAENAVKQKTEQTQGIGTAIEWLRNGTEGQRKLAGIVCRWLFSGVDEANKKPSLFDPLIVDFRNRALVDRILGDSHDKIYITYGAHHLEGIIPLLNQADPRWQVESVSWTRPIEAPENFEAEL